MTILEAIKKRDQVLIEMAIAITYHAVTNGLHPFLKEKADKDLDMAQRELEDAIQKQITIRVNGG